MAYRRFVVLVVTAAIAFVSTAAAQDPGVLLCANGTFVGKLCQAGECSGKLLTSCASGKIMSHSKAKLSYLQGVCDDNDDVVAKRCAGKFSYYSESCGGSNSTQGNLEFIRSNFAFRFCYDPTAASDCSPALFGGGVAGTIFQKGKGTYEIQREASPPEASMTVLADFNFDKPGFFKRAKSFTFNGETHRVNVKRAFGVSRATAAGCDTEGACGVGGCVVKLE